MCISEPRTPSPESLLSCRAPSPEPRAPRARRARRLFRRQTPAGRCNAPPLETVQSHDTWLQPGPSLAARLGGRGSSALEQPPHWAGALRTPKWGFWEILHPGRRTQYQSVAARVVVLQEGAGDSGVGLRGPQSLAPNPESRAPRMEARGIEPLSENDSETATTCVDEACGLTTAAPRRPRQRQALRTSRSEERRVGKECRSRWSPYH